MGRTREMRAGWGRPGRERSQELVFIVFLVSGGFGGSHVRWWITWGMSAYCWGFFYFQNLFFCLLAYSISIVNTNISSTRILICSSRISPNYCYQLPHLCGLLQKHQTNRGGWNALIIYFKLPIHAYNCTRIRVRFLFVHLMVSHDPCNCSYLKTVIATMLNVFILE